MRKPLSTQKLERILHLLPSMTDADVLRLQIAVNQFVRLRRTVNDRALLGHQKGNHNAENNNPVG